MHACPRAPSVHADVGYLEGSTIDTLQPTAWIPLVPATVENGCMEVLAHGHRAGLEARHQCCTGDSWYIEIAPGEVERIGCDPARDSVVAECDVGDVLFINNVIPHRSLSNVSDHVRWSLDLRWQKTGLPAGFYGVKETLEVARGSDPSFKPNFAGWAEDDRTPKQMRAVLDDPVLAAHLHEVMDAKAAKAAAVAASSAAAAEDAASNGGAGAAAAAPQPAGADAFDTVIAGPWMARWAIVNHNKHVDRHLAERAAGLSGTAWHGHSAHGAVSF